PTLFRSDPLTGLTGTYGYDAAGRLTAVSYGANRPGRTYTYDNLGRTATDTQTKAAGTTAASTSYGYDNDDLLTSRTTTGYAGADANTYGYAARGRLTGWTRPDPTTVSNGNDGATNRTTSTDPTCT